jgi:class 3 adenylate cyclase
MRCGISIGEATSIMFHNGSLRVFGSVVNKSSRLEAISDKENIIFDNDFYEKLKLEKNKYIHTLESTMAELKGFETQTVYKFKYHELYDTLYGNDSYNLL